MCISALGRSRQWERALSLLDEMRECGVTPNAISFSAAISACENGGKWERSLSLLDEMRERGVRPDVVTYTALMQALAASGCVEEGFALLRDFEAAGLADTPDSYSAHRTLLQACRASGIAAQGDWVQTTMDHRGLSSIAAVARSTYGGEELG